MGGGGGVTVLRSGCSEDLEVYSSSRADPDRRGCGSSETWDWTSAKASSSLLILSIIHLTSCFLPIPSATTEFDTLRDNQTEAAKIHGPRRIPRACNE